MEYGMGQRSSDGTISWARIAAKLPHKNVQQVIEYSRLFEFYLAKAERDTTSLPGNVPVQTVFMDKSHQEVHPCYAWHLLLFCLHLQKQECDIFILSSCIPADTLQTLTV